MSAIMGVTVARMCPEVTVAGEGQCTVTGCPHEANRQEMGYSEV